MKLDRRQLMKAIGLSGLGGVGMSALHDRRAQASGSAEPMRVVFFVTPHGHVPNAWRMPVLGPNTDVYTEHALGPLAQSDFGTMLRPLYPLRQHLIAIEGLTRTSVLANLAQVAKTGGDNNNHNVAVSDLLTCEAALQRYGLICTGGARSLDQELGLRTGAPGRFGSRVYGFDYTPNASPTPFSFLGPGQASPIVSSPTAALQDLLGYYKAPTEDGGALSRDKRLAELRPSVLDLVAREYQALAPQLSHEGRERLANHQQLIRDLEQSLTSNRVAHCDPSVDTTGHTITQFMRLIRMAFACDLTRVATFVAPVPECPEFGYPADAAVHSHFAHASIAGATSCGQAYSPVAEQAMTDLSTWYANHLATLLRELDSVVEGSGTLLDRTVVVWVSELATPTHEHHNGFTLMAGGRDFFKTGSYVRYPESLPSPLANMPRTGPALSKLYVSVMQAMGQPDTSFGMSRATAHDGTALWLDGPLKELHRV